MKLSEKLIKIRKENGLSQEEFAEKINSSRQAVSRWEIEQSEPDLDKLREIAKVFGVSYEYLLNEEVELAEKPADWEVSDKPKKRKILLKVIVAILIIYGLICLYKLIVLVRFYKIAESFSEENYWMSVECVPEDKEFSSYTSITKVGNKKITELFHEFGDAYPMSINYMDADKEVYCTLTYHEESDRFDYYDRKEGLNAEELENLFVMENDVKDYSLGIIPSTWKDRLYIAVNPFCGVSIKKREIVYTKDGWKGRITLTNDCLVESHTVKSEFDGSLKWNFNYDYVLEHFADERITDPLVKYADKIQYQNEEE